MTSYDASPSELHALRLAETQLADKGIAPGHKGYDLNTLAITIYELGGSYSIDQSSGSFVAEIRPQQPMKRAPRGAGVGWTAESALMFALVQAVSAGEEQVAPGGQ